MLVLGLASLAWIARRWVRMRQADGEEAAVARRDFAVGTALAVSWLSVWALYAAYTWTARPGIGTWPTDRFYLPAIEAPSRCSARGCWSGRQAWFACPAGRRWPPTQYRPASW